MISFLYFCTLWADIRGPLDVNAHTARRTDITTLMASERGHSPARGYGADFVLGGTTIARRDWVDWRLRCPALRHHVLDVLKLSYILAYLLTPKMATFGRIACYIAMQDTAAFQLSRRFTTFFTSRAHEAFDAITIFRYSSIAADCQDADTHTPEAE